MTTIQPATRIILTALEHDTTTEVWRGEFGEFVTANEELDPEEVTEIKADLEASGYTTYGGGAAALFGITLELPSA